jgi:hypothetical protein
MVVVQSGAVAGPKVWVSEAEEGDRDQLENGDVLTPMEMSASTPEHPCPIPLPRDQS